MPHITANIRDGRLSPKALELFERQMPDFGLVHGSLHGGDGCNVIGVPFLHPFLPITAVCVKHTKREAYKIVAQAGGRGKFQRESPRYLWRKVGQPYYMIWTANTRTEIVLSWPEYTVNHTREVPKQLRRCLADMG